MDYQLSAFSLSLFCPGSMKSFIRRAQNMYGAIKLHPPTSMFKNLLADLSNLSMSFAIHPKRNRSREETLPVPETDPSMFAQKIFQPHALRL